MREGIYSLVFCLSLFSSVSAQGDYARKIIDTLCSPHYDGRGYVNDGDVRSATFIKDELIRIGVEPGINDDYFQTYSFGVNTFPYDLSLELDSTLLKPGIDYLVHPISGTAQGKFKVKEINSSNYFTTYGGHVNAKEFTQNQTLFCFNFTDIKNSDKLQEIQKNAYQVAQFFPVIWVTNKKKMWGVGRFNLNYPILEVDSARYNNPTSVNLKVNNKFVATYQTKNIVGKIPGKKKKKYIVFSAHYDHLGRMGKNCYFPGANDNASGVAMLLSLAQYYAKNKPEYTLYFCFFSGEEAGLEGSKYFVQHPSFKLKRVQFVLNIDIMGGAEDGITIVNGKKHTEAFDQLTEINKNTGYLPAIKARGESANSDHYFFSQNNVPAFFIYSMGSVKNYHDIYDTAENTTLGNFGNVKSLLIDFVSKR